MFANNYQIIWKYDFQIKWNEIETTGDGSRTHRTSKMIDLSPLWRLRNASFNRKNNYRQYFSILTGLLF